MSEQELIPPENFLELPQEEQRSILLKWRSSGLNNLSIAKALGLLPMTKYWAFVKKLGLPRKSKQTASNGYIYRLDLTSSESEVSATAQEGLSVASRNLPAVINYPDLSIYEPENFPFEVTELNIRQKGLLPDVAIVCRNPELVDHAKQLPSLVFKSDDSKIFFGNKLIVVVGYKEQL